MKSNKTIVKWATNPNDQAMAMLFAQDFMERFYDNYRSSRSYTYSVRVLGTVKRWCVEKTKGGTITVDCPHSGWHRSDR